MKYRKWWFPATLCMLAVYTFAYVSTEEGWQHWLRKIALYTQLSPRLTAVENGLISIVTILFAIYTIQNGRWYCGFLCPAGIVQEIFSRIGAKLGIRRLRYISAPGKILLPALVGVASIFGVYTIAQLADPVGLFGRLAMPLVQMWRYLFNGEEVFPAVGQALTLIIMIAGAFLLIILPLRKGRYFCDRFCPVGTLFGTVACISKKRQAITINKEKCVSCGRCESVCPTQCTDSKGKNIVPDRCIECEQCMLACKFNAVERLPLSAAQSQKDRRSFLNSVLTLGAAGIFFISRPLSFLFAKDSPMPQITPPGTGGDTRHRQYCIGCQACIASCPMHIIQVNDKSGLRPVLNYDIGFCHYNCKACLTSCAAQAFIRPWQTLEERQRIRVARVTLDLPQCVVLLNNTGCGACAEVCPTHALQMVAQPGANGAPDPAKPTIPNFDPAYCIGCGACYHACPAEPRAFIVQGLAKHETAQGIRPSITPESEAPVPHTLPEPGELTDFPF